MNSSLLTAVSEEPESVRSKLGASHLEGTDSPWCARSAAKCASRVERHVSKALKVLPGVVADATR